MQARILAMLRDEGTHSRVDLAHRLDVSRTTIATEVARLSELGLAREAGQAASRGGRRSTMVDLVPDIRFVGIAIGATGMSVGVTDGRLKVLGQRQRTIDIRHGPETVLATALQEVRLLLKDLDVAHVFGCGVGVPGPVDFHRGVPVSPPIMPGWDRFPVRDVVSRELGCPAELDNDVNVMAAGEQHSGAASTVKDFLFVKLSTGIGCGIVVDGRIYRGMDGCAGDIGHIRIDDFGPSCACGNTGCLEAYAGAAALIRDATSLARSGQSEELAAIFARQGSLGLEDLATAVSKGDPHAALLIKDAGRHIGHVLASLVSFFNPGLIVLGGRLTGVGHGILSEIRGVTYRRSLPLATANLPIALSELGENAGVVGAARIISDSVYAPTLS